MFTNINCSRAHVISFVQLMFDKVEQLGLFEDALFILSRDIFTCYQWTCLLVEFSKQVFLEDSTNFPVFCWTILFLLRGIFVSVLCAFLCKWFFVHAFLCVLYYCVCHYQCESLTVCVRVCVCGCGCVLLLYPGRPCHVTVTRKQLSCIADLKRTSYTPLFLLSERERKRGREAMQSKIGKHSHRKKGEIDEERERESNEYKDLEEENVRLT